MKKITTILSIGLLTFGLSLTTVFAQAPEKMSYQAVVRNAGNALVTTQSVGMQISILQGGSTGTPVYVETQTPTTNINGLVSIEIGSGTVVTGTFNTIDWSAGPYFIKTETDPTGGTTYTITGTSQLMSVPYALHAKTAESITGTVNYTETDPVFGASIANGITALDTANWNNHIIDTDTQLDSTDIANLGYNAGGITTEVDGSVTNEIQDLQLSGNNLTITNNGTATTIDLSPYLDNTDTQLDETAVDAFVANNGYLATEVDGSVTNEIQDLQLSGNNLTITNNGTATTIDLSPYLDNTDTQLDETAVDAFVANNGYLATEVDGSLTNEIQDLQLSGNNLTITNNGTATTIDLSPYLDNTDNQLDSTDIANLGYNAGGITTEVDGSVTNEIQTISRTGTTVTLSNGGGTFTDSVNTYTAGTGIAITNNVISASDICGLSIGDTYQGGIIFYLDASGCHGLISAPTDQSTGIAWWNGSYTDTYASGSGLFDGDGNCYRIRASQGDCVSCNAAELCLDLTLNSQYDWYLPSKYELNLMYENIGQGNSLGLGNVGGFAFNYYWSSTESGNDNAWEQHFFSGSQLNSTKYFTNSVRAVRAF
jgi:hypothetical protein